MNKRKRTKKKKKPLIRNNVQIFCESCSTKLPYYNLHHKYCHKCWKEQQVKKGNYAILDGIRISK